MDKELKEQLLLICDIAEEARKEYNSTKKWTTIGSNSCDTIRVPVYLLNRIREIKNLIKE